MSGTVTLVVTDDGGATRSLPRSVSVVRPAIHVGDLDVTSAVQQRSQAATVTIGIHDSHHDPVAGLTVSVIWNAGTIAACTTRVADGARCAEYSSEA